MPTLAAQPGAEVIGKWKFTSVLDATEIASIDEQQARKLIGKTMIILKDGARFGNEVCGAASFETKRVEPKLYLREEANITSSNLGLPNPVTVVDISCTQVFIKKPNHAVIYWDGFFFGAVRVSR
jgi:hypothetical protein